MVKSIPRLIAFYLPQYHPIPENDEWWGKGFTEWTNVANARPLFKGHYQPHLPADLGFYDLRVPEVRQAQADMAREYGIHGFCYYHYWFNGKQLLERPFQEVLESGKPDFPFCLCWANENWTRRWDGQNQEILIQQQYSIDDDIAHIHSLVPALKDKRYICVDGKPLILIYRSKLIPNPKKTIEIWRNESIRQGIGDLFILRVESFPNEQGDPGEYGFDGAVEFQPDWKSLKKPSRRNLSWKLLACLLKNYKGYQENRVYSYSDLINYSLDKDIPIYLRYPCVTPRWDNSPRRKNDAVILSDSSPELYEYWLSRILKKYSRLKSGEFIFINAWNEWGEGNHLEPDEKFHHGYLEATMRSNKNNDKL